MSISSHFGNFVSGPKYYVIACYFSFCLAHLALQMENIIQKITQPKWRKTKNEVIKICDELGINVIKLLFADFAYFGMHISLNFGAKIWSSWPMYDFNCKFQKVIIVNNYGSNNKWKGTFFESEVIKTSIQF